MYRILLADDEGIMLESLKSIISSNYGNECEIHTAKTGRAVVEEAEKDVYAYTGTVEATSLQKQFFPCCLAVIHYVLAEEG